MHKVAPAPGVTGGLSLRGGYTQVQNIAPVMKKALKKRTSDFTFSSFEIIERILKAVFFNVYSNWFIIVLSASVIGVLIWMNITKENKINYIAALYVALGNILWWFIYKMFDGFDVFLNDEQLRTMPDSKQKLWAFELVTFVIPIILMWYKWGYSTKYLVPLIKSDPNRAREMLMQQFEREDMIMNSIPVILFGVGTLFDRQNFFHNRHLLGAVFFGSAIPYIISSLITDTTDVARLFYFGMIRFVFIIIGITMILISLFKYFNFKKAQKKLKKKGLQKTDSTKEFSKDVEELRNVIVKGIVDELKACVAKTSNPVIL